VQSKLKKKKKKKKKEKGSCFAKAKKEATGLQDDSSAFMLIWQ